MQKLYKFILLCLVLLCLFVSCNKDIEYKNMQGYDEYISDSDTGYEDAPYFNAQMYSVISENKEAVNYYKNNVRRCGRYLITDYKDGVCINRCYNLWGKTINIPETLDGKPVVKLGAYVTEELIGDTIFYKAVSAFSGIENCVLNIPSTVKYINHETLYEFIGMLTDKMAKESPFIAEINVDKDNPYYYSENGILFTKDKKSLLYHPLLNDMFYPNFEYTIPDFVDNFEPMSGVSADCGCLIFGKNIKQINTNVCDGEGIDILDYANYDSYLLVKGYKGTVAEKWARKYRLKFIPLD